MKNQRGFTLIELLAVIVILAIIALVSVPLVLKYIETSKKEALKGNINSIDKAILLENISSANEKQYNDINEVPVKNNNLNIKITYKNGVNYFYQVDNSEYMIDVSKCENVQFCTIEEINTIKDIIIKLKPIDNTLGYSCENPGSLVVTPGEDFIFDASYETITGYRGTDTDIVIPCKINNISVKKIGLSAFKGKNLTSVVLPNIIEEIGTASFARNNLKEIIIPDSVKTIAGAYNSSSTYYEGAFEYNKLTTVVFGSSLESIGRNSFINNGTIENLDFTRCNNLSVIGSWSFRGNKIKKLDLSNCDKLTRIYELAFANNAMTDLKLNEQLITLDRMVFQTNNLSSVTIPANVTSIGNSVFASNPNLFSITVNGKQSESDFTTLGDSWNGSCTNIIYNK